LNTPLPSWRHFSAGLLTVWLLLSPTGLVGAAIQPDRDAGRNLRLGEEKEKKRTLPFIEE